ncbi:MAG: pimeloyl-ACP methyl ester carboxylesterase [Candidatus Pelagisphaera sp.]|jgi:pimeloyl-ACP methyl ester carboxylesterase
MSVPKRSRKRLLSWSVLGVGIAVVLVLILGSGFSGCATFSIERAEAENRFRAKGLNPPEFVNAPLGEGSLHFASVGDGETAIVFVHGSPGSWSAFMRYLMDEDLIRLGRVISVDRPGFGESLPKRAEPSLKEQSRQIFEALSENGVNGNAVLIGHSLGGPVIARMAADYPDFVKGLVLVAPSMDPDLEKRRWFNYVAKVPFVKWGLSRAWVNSNDEIFPHKKELEELADLLPGITASTIVIQGMEDDLVPPANADYVERIMTGVISMDVQRIDGLNHFVPWSRPDLIKEAIVKLVAEETGK